MKKLSRMILDSLKVTDDDDEFEDDEYELAERKQRQQRERRAAAPKKEAPAMRRYDNDSYDDEDEEENDSIARARTDRAQQYRNRAENNERKGYTAPQRPVQQRPMQQPVQQRTEYRPAPPMRSQVTSADVCILRPKRFEECQEIIDVLKSGRVIFLTFDSTNPAIANRIMDFSFGAVYALDAQIIQLSGNNFVIAPEDAEISGEYLNSLTAANYGSWNNNVDANGKR